MDLRAAGVLIHCPEVVPSRSRAGEVNGRKSALCGPPSNGGGLLCTLWRIAFAACAVCRHILGKGQIRFSARRRSATYPRATWRRGRDFYSVRNRSAAATHVDEGARRWLASSTPARSFSLQLEASPHERTVSKLREGNR